MKRLAIAALLVLVWSPGFAKGLPDKIDPIFAAYAKNDSPGCAVGISVAGKPLLERGYGIANLEHGVPITASTIFESGSVSKQFTAAAVMLLAKDGKLSIDDPARRYLPELDESASAVTIRHLLTHTSGLRDWGAIVGLAGWPRGTRLITNAHILDIMSRQKELNWQPGTQWTYNTGAYNLLAIIVERVSGKSFPDFTRERIFAPLGMTHSSWRDDYTRVVKGRAAAYDLRDGAFHTNMDIENIYGNCCMLTTVGDLLRWNTAGQELMRDMQTPAKLANGITTDYGFGLFIRDREIYHSGATAGYRAFLTHYTKDDLSIALLCNRGDAATGSLVEKVAAAMHGAPASASTEPLQTKPRPGLYRDPKTNAILRIVERTDAIRIALRPTGAEPALVPAGENRYRIGRTVEIRFEDDGLHLISNHKPEAVYVRASDATPVVADYAGTFHSDEAEATWVISSDGGKLTAKILPARILQLEPAYTDGFITSDNDLVHFTRDAEGHVNGFDVKADFSIGDGSGRVERMHFATSSPAPSTETKTHPSATPPPR